MSDNSRQKQFKNTGKHKELRRRRVDDSWELRKQRTDEQLMKRRNVDVHDDNASDDEQQNAPPSGIGVSSAVEPKSLQPMALLDCFNILENGGDYERRFKAVEGIRRHLSRQKNPPIDEVIKMGMVPYLINMLTDPSYGPEMKFEAAWALSNITSGSSAQTMAADSEFCILPLIELLSSPDMQVAEKSACALGNIAGDSVFLRDKVISCRIVEPLLALANRQDTPDACMRAVAFTLSNICRYKIQSIVAISVVKELIAVLAKLIYHHDAGVVCDVCWALADISDGDEERINLVFSSGVKIECVLERMAQLASGSDMTLIAPSLRCLGNIVTGDDKHRQAVINSGILMTVVPVAFNSNKSALARESCWLLSNICAGNSQQIQAVLDSGLIIPVIQLLDKGEFRTQIEANWIIYNICVGGTPEQSVNLLQQGALTAVCNILKTREANAETLDVALKNVDFLLGLAATRGNLEQATKSVEECGGFGQIEQLQNHENEIVCQTATQLVDKYFSET